MSPEPLSRVVIVKDHRLPATAAGLTGKLVGMKSLAPDCPIPNVAKELMIHLEDGTTIWGYQCDWEFSPKSTTSDRKEEELHG